MKRLLLIFLVFVVGCSDAEFFEPLPTADNGQYFFEHGKDAVLVVHGLSATPWEVLGISVYLTEHNYTVLTPVLEGHGRRPVDLEATTWKDWYGNVNDSYTRLSKDYDDIFVVGVSTGGGLALQLAREHELSGIVTIKSGINDAFFNSSKTVVLNISVPKNTIVGLFFIFFWREVFNFCRMINKENAI